MPLDHRNTPGRRTTARYALGLLCGGPRRVCGLFSLGHRKWTNHAYDGTGTRKHRSKPTKHSPSFVTSQRKNVEARRQGSGDEKHATPNAVEYAIVITYLPGHGSRSEKRRSNTMGEFVPFAAKQMECCMSITRRIEIWATNRWKTCKLFAFTATKTYTRIRSSQPIRFLSSFET